MAEEKPCSRCGKIKPLTEFHKDKRAKSGIKGICKKCILTRNAERQKEYLKEHPNLKTKCCTSCQKELSISFFPKSKYSLDGCNSYCKKCNLEQASVYQRKNLDKAKIRCTKWRRKQGVQPKWK